MRLPIITGFDELGAVWDDGVRRTPEQAKRLLEDIVAQPAEESGCACCNNQPGGPDGRQDNDAATA